MAEFLAFLMGAAVAETLRFMWNKYKGDIKPPSA